MPPPPLPEANSTSGKGPAPGGRRSPIGAYTPSIISTYSSATGMSEPCTGCVTTTCCGSRGWDMPLASARRLRLEFNESDDRNHGEHDQRRDLRGDERRLRLRWRERHQRGHFL